MPFVEPLGPLPIRFDVSCRNPCRTNTTAMVLLRSLANLELRARRGICYLLPEEPREHPIARQFYRYFVVAQIHQLEPIDRLAA